MAAAAGDGGGGGGGGLHLLLPLLLPARLAGGVGVTRSGLFFFHPYLPLVVSVVLAPMSAPVVNVHYRYGGREVAARQCGGVEGLSGGWMSGPRR